MKIQATYASGEAPAINMDAIMENSWNDNNLFEDNMDTSITATREGKYLDESISKNIKDVDHEPTTKIDAILKGNGNDNNFRGDLDESMSESM